MISRVEPADNRHRITSRHDKLVVITNMIDGLRSSENKLFKIKPAIGKVICLFLNHIFLVFRQYSPILAHFWRRFIDDYLT